jgi:hypothetical protein
VKYDLAYNIPKYEILHSYRRENLKSYIDEDLANIGSSGEQLLSRIRMRLCGGDGR